MPGSDVSHDRWRRYWDKESASYDRQMQLFERFLSPDSRAWVCSKATGKTLEVGIGTGLNLPFYPDDVSLTGIDLSPAMLQIARNRAAQQGRMADLREADALDLPFPDACFDTVVSTYALCAVPDESRAVSEMNRVLRPGGLLLLADHIEGGAWPTRLIQRLIEVVTVRLQGEHFLRRPLRQVRAEGFEIEQRQRFKLGLIERLAARKPVAG
jgi:ubiquinone/menaquinone biosynthesis C-methylase UbiE